MKRLSLAHFALAFALAASTVAAQRDSTQQLTGIVERVSVRSDALRGNLSEEPADRDVSVYLPPSYATSSATRYPVIYLLHGFTDDDNKWFGRVKHWIDVPSLLNESLAATGSGEVIVVMPNANTRYFGSFYSTSVTIGDWETFIASELVSFIDRRYRTLPVRDSRGIAGHSMGGYGALRIGGKHPETFSVVYALSPCCIDPAAMVSRRPSKAAAVQTFAEIATSDFSTKVDLAGAAAWSPNPKRPPLFLNLLVENGGVNPEIAAKWNANGILSTLDQHISQIRRLRAIAFDAGDKDIPGIPEDSKRLSEALSSYGITHSFEIYPGTHVSGVPARLRDTVLPFFLRHLKSF